MWYASRLWYGYGGGGAILMAAVVELPQHRYWYGGHGG